MSRDAVTTARYRPDAGRSLTVQAFAGGLLSSPGHNPVIAIRDFTGTAECDPDTLAQAALRLSINADSLTVISEMRGKDRLEIEETMHGEMPGTARYPGIVFASTVAAGALKLKDKLEFVFEIAAHRES
ncbi:MAG TPA: hypothetical protein VNQ79_04070 [Blastocatellia bacterium]|nr:hypothetical protein [Blastocatellia bacterium]